MKSTSVIEEESKIFLEIILENESQQFKLENKSQAHSLSNKIRFAKADFDEKFFTMPNYIDEDD